jgi:hypothetical protein
MATRRSYHVGPAIICRKDFGDSTSIPDHPETDFKWLSPLTILFTFDAIAADRNLSSLWSAQTGVASEIENDNSETAITESRI